MSDLTKGILVGFLGIAAKVFLTMADACESISWEIRQGMETR